MNGNEKFDYKEVTRYMNSIDSYCSNFAKNVKLINQLIENKINKKPDGAIYGDLALKIKRLWLENSSNFDEFYRVFQSWNNAVVQIGMNNLTLEEFANKIAQTTK